MKAFIIALMLLLGTLTSAVAQQNYPRDASLSWLNAAEYVNGTLIEAGDLEFVKIDCYRHNDVVPTFTATVPVTGEGLAQTEVFADVIPKPGTYRCEGFSIVIGDIFSDASGSAFKRFVGKPKFITILTFD